MNVIQNKTIDSIKNEVVEKAVNEIFGRVIGLNYFKDISNDVAIFFKKELENASFMSTNLRLSDEQTEKIFNFTTAAFNDCIDRYKAKIKNDERTADIARIVEEKVMMVINEAFAAVAKEVNRGAILNTCAVLADSKNENYNKIELRHDKETGDITVPTRGVFIATNCIELIKNSVRVVRKAESAKEAETETDESDNSEV